MTHSKDKAQDQQLSRLFSEFHPQMSGDAQFMRRLEMRIDSIEAVRAGMAEFRARQRRSVRVALVVGFAVGVMASVALPYITAMMRRLFEAFSGLDKFGILLTENSSYAAWIVVATASVLSSLSAYEFAGLMMRTSVQSTKD